MDSHAGPLGSDQPKALCRDDEDSSPPARNDAVADEPYARHVLIAYSVPMSMTRIGRFARVASALVLLGCASVAPTISAQSAAPNAVATAPLTLTRAKPAAVG